ncbi:hypothetical protein WMF39_09845 [Sorangium sp. So ce1504]|uniref:hypothetical protein n=1 Tax=Sorangium sp. So ce1504 TaxID=3133337 RepID=UPI003F635E55
MLHGTVFVLVFLALFAALELALGLYRRTGVLTMRELGASASSRCPTRTMCTTESAASAMP